MSKSDVLYVKDMNVSEGDGEEGDEDIWDDRKLNDAYDKALKMANAEVAKRVAMSTNSQGKSKSDSSQNKKQQPKPNAPHSQKKKLKWKTGMPCRAIYDEDGLEYEACVLSLMDDKKCVVRFLGYNNTETVEISTLQPSRGDEARMRQIEEALVSEQPDYMSQSSHSAASVTGPSELGERNLLEAESSASKHSKSSKKKKRQQNRNQKSMNGFDLPEMPFQMPNLSMLMNSGSYDMPLPPPPPMLPPASGRDAEEQAVSSMLLSWYMSGYYTGLYQGLKRSKENGRNK